MTCVWSEGRKDQTNETIKVHGADRLDPARSGGGRAGGGSVRTHGLSSPTFYKWKAKYGGLDASEARRLKALEDENARLTRRAA